MKISVIGAGSWGTALARLLAKKGYDVGLWVYEDEVCDCIKNTRENVKYLPGITMPENIKPSTDLQQTVEESRVLVLAVPSHLVRSMSARIGKFIEKDQIIVNVAKGLEDNTFLRLSQVIEETVPGCRVAVLSGPSHAEEVSRDLPTAVVVSARDKHTAEYIQDIFMTPKFRVYTNLDMVGVEISGALKNVIALAVGISDGLGFGDNTRAALMTRGIVEISRLGRKLKANPLTFAGLSGIGDLIVTCTSRHSRNRRAGIAIGRGATLEDITDLGGMVVEGVNATRVAYRMSKKLKVEMPIVQQLYRVLFRNGDPREAVVNLMLRNKTEEIEATILNVYENW
ncbi:MAG TPA: NAD(P)H-dependent glycerol-3-phosphate dehydrogenase [Clostridiales bacterium]|mgnify:CR=1 FL=1|nr:NAD(P)H-dependent glycerol-3-phosphate dehydrogenase [Clostridiales bacterium]